MVLVVLMWCRCKAAGPEKRAKRKGGAMIGQQCQPMGSVEWQRGSMSGERTSIAGIIGYQEPHYTVKTIHNNSNYFSHYYGPPPGGPDDEEFAC